MATTVQRWEMGYSVPSLAKECLQSGMLLLALSR